MLARGLRPSRPNIPLPPFPPGMSWIGGPEPVSERLTARGPLLVHFFEVGELSSVRTLPFVTGLHRTLGEHGLSVIGVHSPRSGLASSDEGLTAALERLDVPFPVVNDHEHRIWHAYGCEGWPSTFLWGTGGTLRWAQFGEGAYHETEAEIRAELAPAGDGGLPGSVLDPPPEGPAPQVERPSEEVFPGGAHDQAWRGEPGEPLEVEYAGAGAWVALSGEGTLEIRVDDEAAAPLEVTAPGLYEISRHDAHGIHEVAIWPEGSLLVWSMAFAPGAKA
jgi:hypothetical protein